MWSILVAVAASVLLSSSLSAQEATQAAEFSNTLAGKLAIAAISALLSLLCGYILFYLKDRKEARRRISYSVDFKKGLLGIEERLAKDLSVSYKGRSAENINYVRCDIVNSGTTVIRKQQLRFEFAAEMEILDWNVEPTPPKELGFSNAGQGDGANEKTVLLAYFPVAERVTLHFILSGGEASDVKIFGFNQEEDIQVLPGNIGIEIDDRRQLERFIGIYLITLFVPNVFLGIPFFGQIASSAFYIGMFIVALPMIPTVSRVIAALFTSLSGQRDASVSIGNIKAKTVTLGVGSGRVSTTQLEEPDQAIEADANTIKQ